jgi:cell division transport system permease protein
MLSSFSIFLVINKIVDNYKTNITNDYSIIISSSKQIDKINTVSGIAISAIKQIDRQKIIGDIKDNLSKDTTLELDQQLSYFANIYLEKLPTINELKTLQKELLKLDFIENVEIFEGNYIKSYSFLVLTKNIATTLFIVILMSSFLMLLQQIKLLFYEYNERIDTLQLFGASLVYSTKFIIRFLLISVAISIVSVFVFTAFIISSIPLIIPSDILMIIPTISDMGFEVVLIIFLAITIPSIAYGALILKHRNNNV